METILLRLAGHTVSVSGSDISSHFNKCGGFDTFLSVDDSAEWAVRYGVDVVPWSDGLQLSEFCFEEIRSRCTFLRKGDDYQFVMFPEAGAQPLVCMRYRRGEQTVEASNCSDSFALRFSLWFACSLLGAESGVTFVHSSTIVYRGKAILFLGESGTGKSTHTRLWLQHIAGSHILNDDSPFLSVEQGCPTVYGSPWSGKTPVYQAKQFPLAAIVRLSQAPYNRIRRLSVPEAFAALQPSLPPALMQDNESVVEIPDGKSHCFFADDLMDILSTTLSAVPVFHLQCLPNREAAVCCQKALEETF